MMFVQENSEISISVVITHHKYEKYLHEAIKSVIDQTRPAEEIIVIDDSPTNNTAKKIVQQFPPIVQYHKTENNNPLKSRETGYIIAKSKFICFLDADDILDIDYLQNAAAEIIVNNADLVYSDIQYFEDTKNGRNYLNKTNYNCNIPKKRISQVNFMHVGCIVKKEIIKNTYAFNHGLPKTKYHEDWAFWRKILSSKCKYVKQSHCYFARKHNNNKSDKINNYYESRGIELSDITYVGLIEKELTDLYCLKDIEVRWPLSSKDEIQLFGCINYNLINNKNPISWKSPWQWDIWNDKKFVVNKVADSCTTDYTFFYHENKRPKLSCLQKMLKCLDHDVAMVHDNNFEPFECTLVVTSILRDYYFHDLEKLPFEENERIIYI